MKAQDPSECLCGHLTKQPLSRCCSHLLVWQQRWSVQMCCYDAAALWGMWHATHKCPPQLPFIIAPGQRHIQRMTTSVSTFAPTISQRCAPPHVVRSVRGSEVLSDNQSLDIRQLFSTRFCEKCILPYVCLQGSNLRWPVFEPLQSQVFNS